MDKKIIEQLNRLNESLNYLLLLLLCREGFTNPQIRKIFGKLDNNRVATIRGGIKRLSQK